VDPLQDELRLTGLLRLLLYGFVFHERHHIAEMEATCFWWGATASSSLAAFFLFS
jgi:hypothetical protein